MTFAESKTPRTRHSPDDQCLRLSRATHSVLRLLRRGNWIGTADVHRAMRPRDRPAFARALRALENGGALERRPTPDGHHTEIRLVTPPPTKHRRKTDS
ncbi:hypothetical protein CH263_25680 [Rhodococcus sp. 06-1059B-a]|nr:hypothetical protein [Rhodococcus sp. 06-1059B-a]OZD57584.1 hypothetical protein CH263_25680 [Rhodococcus sp. 06-1059B-a]